MNTTTDNYTSLVNLLSVFSEATARMDGIQNELHSAYLDLVDAIRHDYADLQATLAQSEEAIVMLATLNPQWFAKARSVKTPYGTVSFRTATKLVAKNEEVTTLLIQQLHDAPEGNPYLRQTTALNLEALEALDDAQLRDLRLKRETTDTCTVKPIKMDLGKAVAAQESPKS